MEYGKRLSELLMEQQEPFLLDEYLKQNGYSRRSPKCHQISGLCCSLSVCKKLLKRRSRGSTGGSTALRSLLNKIMYQKVIRKLMNWGCGKQMEFTRLHNSFEGDSNGEDDDWKKMEVTSRQLSPVSVFELHSDEDSSPTHEYSNFKDEELSTSSRGSEGEEELQISAISSLKNNVLGTDVQEMIWEPQENLRSQMSLKQTDEQVLSWEKITRDINKIPTLIEYDFTKSEKQWYQLKQDMVGIGSEIETLIFEEIRKEAVLDLLGSHCTL
ncbi:hypothetical protein FCM35_KLT01458 [Carex littledalei]|uniref:DUF4378 domain-containing protein n=1 Tax=Carex littledalei TaxID=544730 RepID=A0A833R4Z2_9POAL|nr:hypothetical protein FCM35_KLT01458 [Carex littledalei]